MFEYRKANIADVTVLTHMRMSMLCDGTNYDDAFKWKLFDNTTAFITRGFEDKSLTIWIAMENKEIVAMGGLTYYVLPPNDWCPSGKTAYIASMYTIPEYRRKESQLSFFPGLLMRQKKIAAKEFSWMQPIKANTSTRNMVLFIPIPQWHITPLVLFLNSKMIIFNKHSNTCRISNDPAAFLCADIQQFLGYHIIYNYMIRVRRKYGYCSNRYF